MLKRLFTSFVLTAAMAAHAQNPPSPQLMWLDDQLTAGYGYERVIAETAPGGLFQGWRPATAGEVLALVGQFTGSPPSFGASNSYAPGTLKNLNIGFQGDGFPPFRGAYFAEADGRVGVFTIRSQWFCGGSAQPPCGSLDSFVINYAGVDDPDGQLIAPYSAVQLVAPQGTPMPSIPEPSQYLMFSLGLAGLAVALGRRKRPLQ